MKAIIKLAVGLVMATALSLGLTVAPAEAKTTTVSAKYTSPSYGQTNSGVTALQRRLVKAGTLKSTYVTGYFGPLTKTAVKKFQAKAKLKQTGKVDKKTWSKLVKKTGTIKITSSSSTTKASKTKGLAKRCRTGKVVCVSKADRKVRWVVNGKVKMTTDARFGGPGHRTREGTFHVFMKSYNHTSSIYHTWMPRAMFFSGGQAIHYSPDFAARGYNGSSHGCVNVRSWKKINYLWKQVKVGTKVVVY